MCSAFPLTACCLTPAPTAGRCCGHTCTVCYKYCGHSCSLSFTQDNAADVHCTRDDGRGRSCGAYQRHGSFIARTKHDCTGARCIFKCNTSVSGHKRETVGFLQRKLLLRSAANCTVSIFTFFGTWFVTISLAHCRIYAVTGTTAVAVLLDCVRCFVQIVSVFVRRRVKSTGLAFGIYCPAVSIRDV